MGKKADEVFSFIKAAGEEWEAQKKVVHRGDERMGAQTD